MNHDRIYLYRALNWWIRGSGWMRRRGKEDFPYGQTREDWQGHGIVMRCLEPSAAYVWSNHCRIERDNYHNRIHHARARWIANQDRTGLVLEFGQTWCGRNLVDPLYSAWPERACDCGKGEPRLCPGCELAFHGEDLAGACELLMVSA